MDAKVVWDHGLTFTGTADTGFQVPLGADPSVGGDNDGFRPMELMALSLAGCRARDVISILLKKRQQVTKFEVIVRSDRASEHPRVFTRMNIDYFIEGKDIDSTAVERAIELSVEKYCPAQAMLREAVELIHTHHIEDAE